MKRKRSSWSFGSRSNRFKFVPTSFNTPAMTSFASRCSKMMSVYHDYEVANKASVLVSDNDWLYC